MRNGNTARGGSWDLRNKSVAPGPGRRRPGPGRPQGRPAGVEPLEGRRLFASAASVFDPTFAGGQAAVSFVTLNSTVQSDGKIVAVGTTDYSNTSLSPSGVTFGLAADSRVAVQRFNPDGSPDPTFNNGQPLLLDPSGADELGNNISGPSEATAVTVDPQGRVLVAGILIDNALLSANAGNAVYLHPFVLRIDAAGHRDTTFDAPIGALHDISGSTAQLSTGHDEEYPFSIALTGSDHVLVAGVSDFFASPNPAVGSVPAPFNFVFLRSYQSDGTPESTFGAGTQNQAGLVTIPAENVNNAFGVNAVYSAPEDAIYLAGTRISPTSPFLLKLTSSGAAFPGFATNTSDFLTQPLDSFTYQPGVTQPIGGGDDAQAVAIGPDGKIVIAGVSGPNVIVDGDHVGLARLNPDGSPDTTFGDGGVFAVPANGANVKGIEIQPDGQIDLAGTITQSDNTLQAFLAALNPDGSFDTGFGNGGVYFDTAGPAPALSRAAAPAVGGAGLVPLSISDIVQSVALASGQSPDGTGILSEVLTTSQSTTVLRRVKFDHTAPTAAVQGGAGVTSAGVASYTFTLDYTDNDKMNAASLNNAGVVVSGPNGYSQTAMLVGTSGSGKSITATYQITPPGATWTMADDGAYNIALQPGTVTDAAGNGVGAAAGQFLVSTVPLTPAQQVQVDAAKLATDTKAQAAALAADKSDAAATAAADKALVAADKAKARADRGDAALVAQDKAQGAADARQSHADAAAAKAQQHRDKATFAALLKADKAKLKIDQRAAKKH